MTTKDWIRDASLVIATGVLVAALFFSKRQRDDEVMMREIGMIQHQQIEMTAMLSEMQSAVSETSGQRNDLAKGTHGPSR
jgi:hypothetical protein